MGKGLPKTYKRLRPLCYDDDDDVFEDDDKKKFNDWENSKPKDAKR